MKNDRPLRSHAPQPGGPRLCSSDSPFLSSLWGLPLQPEALQALLAWVPTLSHSHPGAPTPQVLGGGLCEVGLERGQ